MNLNPKKIIGSLGRKYGGRPFQVFRDGCYTAILRLKNFKDTALVFLGGNPSDPITQHILTTLYNNSGTPVVNSDKEPKQASRNIVHGAICILDGSFTHGGLTDRLRGILSAFAEASKRQLPFYICWTHPFPLTDYLLPNKVDWRIREEEVCRSLKHSKMVVIDDLTDAESQLRLNAAFSRKKTQLHLYTNADTSRGNYRALFHTLFRPSERLKEALEYHKSRLTHQYEAFAFRFLTLLNDFTDFEVPPLNSQEQQELIEKVTEELKSLIKEIPSDRSIFITGDSIRFLNHVKDLDPRIYIVEGEVKHIDLDKNISPLSELKTFVDQFLLMGADKVTLLRTGRMYKSGFSRFAAEVGGATFIDHSF